ncbi:MAG: lipoyl domain-containing protein [Leptospirales bacterium]
MKLHELRVPDVGEGPIELHAWQKAPGEEFQEDDELCDLVTDKASFSIEAPGPGKIIEILTKEKQNVAAGDVVAKVELY